MANFYFTANTQLNLSIVVARARNKNYVQLSKIQFLTWQYTSYISCPALISVCAPIILWCWKWFQISFPQLMEKGRFVSFISWSANLERVLYIWKATFFLLGWLSPYSSTVMDTDINPTALSDKVGVSFSATYYLVREAAESFIAQVVLKSLKHFSNAKKFSLLTET